MTIRNLNHRPIAIVFTLLLLSGCSAFSKIEPESGSFPGLLNDVKSAPPSSDIVFIHGMCSHDASWFETQASIFAKHTGLKVSAIIDVPVVGIEPIKLYSTTLNNDVRSVNAYGIIYSGATGQYKTENLCRDVEKETSSCPNPGFAGKRATVNRLLKDSLLNSCLSDAMIYNGSSGIDIRRKIKSILSHLYDLRSRQGAQSVPLALVSESLGSKIIRDSLLCDTFDEESAKGFALMRSANSFFMLANQIPLLNAANNDSCSDLAFSTLEFSTDRKERRGDFSDLIRLLDGTSAELESFGIKPEKALNPRYWIAFTDDNDILSYRLDPSEYDDLKVFNVTVKNTRFNWFGLLANPYIAHTGYRNNAAVQKLIRCGYRHLVEPIETC